MSSTEPTAPQEYRSGPATQDAAAGSVPPAAGRSTGYTSHRYGDPPPARTWWDVIIGGILVGTGVVVLGDVAVASVVSVIFLGWTLVIGGVVGMVVSFFLIGRGGFWIGMLGGLLALVVGMVFLRHPGSTLVAFSLAIGAVLLISGVTRLIAAVQHREARGALVVSGVLSLVLGLLIFAEWPSSTLWLVGTLLGIQLIIDGLALIFVGRPWRSRV
jgi:uncharacterized membrane protein HdeD (DUF308 family)